MPLPSSGAEPEAWLSLDLISGLGPESIRQLLGEFGAPAAVFQQPTAMLSRIVGAKKAALIAAGPSAERLATAMKWLEEDNNHLLTLADEDYPRRLLETPDPPVILYLKGRRDLLGQGRRIGFRGSRQPQRHSKRSAEC